MMSQFCVSGRKVLGAAVLCAATALASGGAAQAQAVDVTIDFAKIMKLDRPAGTIVIGNPGIADASVQDEKTLVLTGQDRRRHKYHRARRRGQGDRQRRGQGVLRRAPAHHRVLRQEAETFSCAPTCEQVISVGDDPERFDTAKKQIENRLDFSAGQASPAPIE